MRRRSVVALLERSFKIKFSRSNDAESRVIASNAAVIVGDRRDCHCTAEPSFGKRIRAHRNFRVLSRTMRVAKSIARRQCGVSRSPKAPPRDEAPSSKGICFRCCADIGFSRGFFETLDAQARCFSGMITGVCKFSLPFHPVLTKTAIAQRDKEPAGEGFFRDGEK